MLTYGIGDFQVYDNTCAGLYAAVTTNHISGKYVAVPNDYFCVCFDAISRSFLTQFL
jgi:hypothetical protein